MLIFTRARMLLIEHLLTHRSGYSYYGIVGGEGPDFRYPYNDLEDYIRHVAYWPVEFERHGVSLWHQSGDSGSAMRCSRAKLL